MSKFKMIEKLGLEIIAPYRASGTEMVRAEDIEDLLQSAQVVYEVENSAGINSWLHIEAIGAKSKALLIGITPIKKKTKAEAALELLERLAKDHDKLIQPEWHVKEAKRILEMKDEV